jgi:hypothetical protein
MTPCQPLLTPAFDQRGLCLLAAGVDVPPPTPDIVPLPPSPHPTTPPSPTPMPPEIIEPLNPGQNEPVREPIIPTPGPSLH